MAELLLELMSEEIPARMQLRAADDLRRLVCAELKANGLAYGEARAFSGPRRLTLVVDGIPAEGSDVSEERRGPRVGAPEQAIQGFLKAAGLASLDQAEKRDTGKGEFWFAVVRKKGGPTTDLTLRIDRVARVGGTYSGGDFGGTDLGVTLLSAGNRETKGLVTWQAASGWTREFRPNSPDLPYTEFKRHPLVLEGPGYFGSELPVAEAMSYGELRQHINELRSSGLGVEKALVDLHRKIAFPFITLIMALIAVPFAVTTGKRGAMYGIGAGIVLAIVYWIAMVVFSGIGAAGLISPLLAAWAPNLVFGSCALYLLLTVRT